MAGRTRDKNYYAYGLSEKRVKELFEYCRENPDSVYIKWAIRSANESLSTELYESIVSGKSYMVLADRGYIPIGEKDFYGYRRQTLYFLNEYLKHEYLDAPGDDNSGFIDVFCATRYDGVENLKIRTNKSAQSFFCCPVCGRSNKYLYLKENGDILCKQCGSINTKIDKLKLKAYSLVERRMRYENWKQENPGENIFQLMYIPRPGQMHVDQYINLLKEYWALVEDFVETKKDELIL